MIKKIIIATLALVGVGALVSYVSVIGSEVALMELHPELDQDVVIKAHREMLRNTLRGYYKDFDTDDDTVCDAIFMSIVNRTSV